jgi:hypothetical protein
MVVDRTLGSSRPNRRGRSLAADPAPGGSVEERSRFGGGGANGGAESARYAGSDAAGAPPYPPRFVQMMRAPQIESDPANSPGTDAGLL